ncbi:hypothetical protein [Microbacterium sp. Se63.02b]|uniref:hypothetical protein n=2 Tax=unclassified Microbacterium TaxID=2609290 RepID=UPI001FCF072F|nr:hypothetical protein [Microbacterium sp. Se63.02b]
MMQALVGTGAEEAGLMVGGIVDRGGDDAHRDDASESPRLVDRVLRGLRSQSLQLPAHSVDQVGGVEAGGVQPGA